MQRNRAEQVADAAEASSLALSHRDPNVLWSLNDSGAPAIVALSPSGELLSRVGINGASVNDWEDLTIAPCGNQSCLYIADTGNGGGTQRNDVVIYRVREPLPSDHDTAPAEYSMRRIRTEKIMSPTPCSPLTSSCF